MDPVANKRALFLQVTEPGAYPPIINACQILCAANWHVDVLSSPLQHHCMRMPQVRGLKLHEMPIRPDFRIRPIDYWRYLSACLALARRGKLDLVYASDPPSALPALLVARLSGAKLVYHEHDSPSRPEHLNRLFRLSRARIFARADHLVFPNDRRGIEVQHQFGFDADKRLTIWNTPRRSEIAENVAALDGPLLVYYHGSINPSRLPMNIADVVARFHGKVAIRVAGYESPSALGYASEFVKRARYGEYLGEFRDRAELFGMATQAHVGLGFMPMQSDDINMQAMTGASNKAFDYMAAGMNLLVSSLPDWQSMFVEPGFARCCDPGDAEDLQNALDWHLQNRAQLASIGARNAEQIAMHWNYEQSFSPLLAKL